MSNFIYQVTTKNEWQQALQKGFYDAPSLASEGFIHCCETQQLAGVLERYFSGKTQLLKLTIDTEKLHSKLQYDFSPKMQEQFPHVYGVINLDAVVDVSEL